MEMESRGYNRWDWRHHIHRLGRFNVLSVILNTKHFFLFCENGLVVRHVGIDFYCQVKDT